MMKKYECLMHLKPGLNDELFESPESPGGYIKLFGEANTEEVFVERCKSVISEYGSDLISVDELKESDVSFEHYPCFNEIYLSPLHTYEK